MNSIPALEVLRHILTSIDWHFETARKYAVYRANADRYKLARRIYLELRSTPQAAAAVELWREHTPASFRPPEAASAPFKAEAQP